MGFRSWICAAFKRSRTPDASPGLNISLPTIDLQSKLVAQSGSIEHYWFGNAGIGLTRTRFHRVVIPFVPFDSGLEHVEGAVSTSLIIEWAALNLEDPADLDGIDLSMNTLAEVEASIYLGDAHNWTHLERRTLTRTGEAFRLHCVGTVELEEEGVAKNAPIDFVTTAMYRGER